MGFNIEQYDNENYSNAVGFGCGFIFNKKRKAECEIARTKRKIKTSNFSVKELFGIGDGKIFGKVVSPRKKVVSDALKKAQEREYLAKTEQSKNSWINIDGYDENYSNAAGYLCELVFNKNKKAECEKARDARKSTTPENVSADTALSKGTVCVKGVPIYQPYVYAVTGRNQRTQNRLICKARKEAKMKDGVPTADAVKDNPLSDAQAPLSSTPEGSKTGMYIGIGVGVLAIGIVAIILIKKRSNK